MLASPLPRVPELGSLGTTDRLLRATPAQLEAMRQLSAAQRERGRPYLLATTTPSAAPTPAVTVRPTLSVRAQLDVVSAVREHGRHLEVAFIGHDYDPTTGVIGRMAVHSRGSRDRIPFNAAAFPEGSWAIHTHPSGDLEPSDADLAVLASFAGTGVGFGIIDPDAERLYSVLTPEQNGYTG